MNDVRRRTLHLALLILATGCLATPGLANAAETLTSNVSLTPDTLGAPTNLSATVKFSSPTAGVPPPVSKVTAYLPAGFSIDARGTGTCSAAALEARGTVACPADSRIGFGGGVGLLELAHEVIAEPFTLDLFFGPSENGHLVVLAFVKAISPAFIELVVIAHEVRAPKPYGLGFTFEIPPIPTLPEASNASIESAFITIGDRSIAYYKTIHGKRKLVHVRGLVVPSTCPHSGFPYEALVSFADGTSLINSGTIACPRSSTKGR